MAARLLVSLSLHEAGPQLSPVASRRIFSAAPILFSRADQGCHPRWRTAGSFHRPGVAGQFSRSRGAMGTALPALVLFLVRSQIV